MIRITNITKDANQKHTILFESNNIDLVLLYHSIIQQWSFNVSYRGVQRNGIRLALGTRHLESAHLPFDFIIEDNARLDVDPFLISDFASGRLSLFLIERDELKQIRGFDVKL
jgi:hypothetical protein